MDERPHTIVGEPAPSANDRGARLDSWKEIAAYLNRDVRTVQRWEKTAALPVRRLQKPGLRAVYAYETELAAWRRDQDPAVVAADAAPPGEITPRRGRDWMGAVRPSSVH